MARQVLRRGFNLIEKEVKMRKSTQLLKAELDKLEAERGVINPRDLVDVARPEDSPIHDLFEWDNAKASEQWRTEQARSLIQSVKVEIMGRKTNAYFNCQVEVNGTDVRGYFGAGTVLSTEDMANQVLVNAIREIKFWQAKYKDIFELKDLINGERIVEVEKKIKK